MILQEIFDKQKELNERCIPGLYEKIKVKIGDIFMKQILTGVKK